RRRGHFPSEQAALKVFYLVIRDKKKNGGNITARINNWLSLLGARWRYCCRSVSPCRSPNPACAFRRTGLSAVLPSGGVCLGPGGGDRAPVAVTSHCHRRGVEQRDAVH